MRYHPSSPALAFAVLSFASPTPEVSSVYRAPEEAGTDRRGVLYTDNSKVQLFVRNDSKVTWQYNWDSLDGSPNGNYWEYVPMLWSASPEHTGHWYQGVDKALKELAPGTTAHALAFNEPDMCRGDAGGTCMSLKQAINEWRNWIEPLRRYGDLMLLGSPSVTNQASPSGLKYLDDFIKGCEGCKIDFVNTHWYNRCDSIDDFKQHVTDALKIGNGRPLWITEFACTTGSVEQKIQFLDMVMPWLDKNPLVHRYAYSFAGPGILLNDAGDNLSGLGDVYNCHE